MNKYVSRGLWFTLFLGGLSLAGVGVANAAETSGDDGVASGSQAAVSLSVPVSLGGNGISLIGDSSSTGSNAGADPAAAPVGAPAAAPAPVVSTSGLGGALSGTQAIADVSVPIAVSGNSVSAVGDTSSSDSSAAATPVPGAAPASDEPSAAPTTSGRDAIASGTQAPVDVAAPVTVGGNAISVLGDSSSADAASQPGSAPSGEGSPGVSPGDGLSTSGDDGILSGTQAPVAAAVPVTAGGNAVSVLGDSNSSGTSSGGGDTAGAGPGATTGGDEGILAGDQLPIGLALPVIVGGNAISLAGVTSTDGAVTDPVAPTAPTGSTAPTAPTAPTTPVAAGTGTGVATAVAATGAVMLLGSGAAETLAQTGSDDLGLGAIAALIALVGVVLTFGARNSTSMKRAHRIHNTK